jgi:hypothetical protein
MGKVRWLVCPVCKGEGKTVNPAIDSHGLTAEDFQEDPDFAGEYLRGTYDITCNGCDGRRVVTQDRIDDLQQNAEDRMLAAREDGHWESGLSDWRWG